MQAYQTQGTQLCYTEDQETVKMKFQCDLQIHILANCWDGCVSDLRYIFCDKASTFWLSHKNGPQRFVWLLAKMINTTKLQYLKDI